MRISIALATYNGEKYLEKQLESFFDQTRLPDELIISDDCSTDNTVTILDNFAKNAPFEVKIFKNKTNLGYSGNFENAVKNCTGDVIFFSDQDDFWFPQKIEKMVDRFMNESDLHLLCCNVEFTDEYLNPSGRTKFENFQRLGIPLDKFAAGCASAFRKDISNFYLPIANLWNYDDWLHAICHIIGTRRIEHSTLQYYRRHGDNTSETFFNKTNNFLYDRYYRKLCTTLKKEQIEEMLFKKIELYNRIKSIQENSDFNNFRTNRIKDLRQEVDLLCQRFNIIKMNPFTRWIHAFLLLSRGRFKHYNLFSVLKDSFLN